MLSLSGCAVQPVSPNTASLAAPAPFTFATRVNSKDGAEMVYVPAGPFVIGLYHGLNESGIVTMDAYWIFKNDVTVAQFRKFCRATGRKMPDPPPWGWKDNHPVVNVSWNSAKAYCDWARVRLPTYAQWEKAARGTDGRNYPWGDKGDPGKLRYSKEQEGDAGSTAPVGSFPAGASPCGCLDKAGNVFQWCADWNDGSLNLKRAKHNPQGPTTGRFRELRGSSWYLPPNRGVDFRCGQGMGAEPTNSTDNWGFRAVGRDVN